MNAQCGARPPAGGDSAARMAPGAGIPQECEKALSRRVSASCSTDRAIDRPTDRPRWSQKHSGSERDHSMHGVFRGMLSSIGHSKAASMTLGPESGFEVRSGSPKSWPEPTSYTGYGSYTRLRAERIMAMAAFAATAPRIEESLFPGGMSARACVRACVCNARACHLRACAHSCVRVGEQLFCQPACVVGCARLHAGVTRYGSRRPGGLCSHQVATQIRQNLPCTQMPNMGVHRDCASAPLRFGFLRFDALLRIPHSRGNIPYLFHMVKRNRSQAKGDHLGGCHAGGQAFEGPATPEASQIVVQGSAKQTVASSAVAGRGWRHIGSSLSASSPPRPRRPGRARTDARARLHQNSRAMARARARERICAHARRAMSREGGGLGAPARCSMCRAAAPRTSSRISAATARA